MTFYNFFENMTFLQEKKVEIKMKRCRNNIIWLPPGLSELTPY